MRVPFSLLASSVVALAGFGCCDCDKPRTVGSSTVSPSLAPAGSGQGMMTATGNPAYDRNPAPSGFNPIAAFGDVGREMGVVG